VRIVILSPEIKGVMVPEQHWVMSYSSALANESAQNRNAGIIKAHSRIHVDFFAVMAISSFSVLII
jgi:hypothetical protein